MIVLCCQGSGSFRTDVGGRLQIEWNRTAPRDSCGIYRIWIIYFPRLLPLLKTKRPRRHRYIMGNAVMGKIEENQTNKSRNGETR